MYGAILGDIIGSRFEFDRGGWSKEFKLLTAEDNWTDDTVMTVAIAEALMDAGRSASVEEIEAECVKSMQRWGRKYPGAGYGGRFIGWLGSKNPRPYGSYGNGSAMRVSAAGWLYDSLERTREVARATANVTHNHPEGIKGAECTAAVIYLARTGWEKENIERYVVKEFGYDFSESLEEMRARHRHDESCQDALPKALRSFFDGTSYEDVVRNAVSLGGDTDTIAAIAGSMAEAFFDMPILLRGECLHRIEKEMSDVIERFDRFVGRNIAEEVDEYADNAPLAAALLLYLDEEDEKKRFDAFMTFLNVLAKRIKENAEVPMPFIDVNDTLLEGLDIEHLKLGDTVQIKDEVRLRMDTVFDGDGKYWLPLYITRRELEKGHTANVIMPVAILDVLKIGLKDESLQGVVVNPFGKPYVMPKELLEKFLTDYEVWIKKEDNAD